MQPRDLYTAMPFEWCNPDEASRLCSFACPKPQRDQVRCGGGAGLAGGRADRRENPDHHSWAELTCHISSLVLVGVPQHATFLSSTDRHPPSFRSLHLPIISVSFSSSQRWLLENDTFRSLAPSNHFRTSTQVERTSQAAYSYSKVPARCLNSQNHRL
eukprot:SAG31_NODE_609_length_13567_cov_18.101574_7_plen_158_part_00